MGKNSPLLHGAALADAGQLVVDLGKYPELKEKGGRVALHDQGILLVRGKKRVRAFKSACPHKPKNQVSLGKECKKQCFHCERHGWTWDRKGRPTGKAEKPLSQLLVQTEDERLVVTLDRS